ncbi:hypothetical protein B0675_36565 [Streptomyces sp. M41(2017)]|nr:hypothetical protein B0675_36565 [Streptomyces sp. M41(2017)]
MRATLPATTAADSARTITTAVVSSKCAKDLVRVGFHDVTQVVVGGGHVQALGTRDQAVGRGHVRVSRGDERGQKCLVGRSALVDECEDLHPIREGGQTRLQENPVDRR